MKNRLYGIWPVKNFIRFPSVCTLFLCPFKLHEFRNSLSRSKSSSVRAMLFRRRGFCPVFGTLCILRHVASAEREFSTKECYEVPSAIGNTMRRGQWRQSSQTENVSRDRITRKCECLFPTTEFRLTRRKIFSFFLRSEVGSVCSLFFSAFET